MGDKEYLILYNSLSNNGKGGKVLNEVRNLLGKNVSEYMDVSKYDSYGHIFTDFPAERKIVIIGGDGTLNRFVNETYDMQLENEIYFYPAGTGNDFWHDVMGESEKKLIEINVFLKRLPLIKVKNKTYRFINGIGYGIDGFACEEADKIRERKPNAKINYTAIALKGLLYAYKPCKATITVDGVTETFDNVWLAPTMKGRYFGGGMMPTPNQNRLDKDGKVSVMTFSNKNKLRTLSLFPKIFTGRHVEYTKYTHIYE